ncbi:MAG: hypothetical protein Fur0016_09680 [Anaerolineales bacterium]
MDPVSLAPAVLTALAPYLTKAGGKLADALAENAPEYAGKLWTAIVEKFNGKPAAEEAARDLLENPADADNQAAFRKEIRKVAEEDPAWLALLTNLLAKAQAEAAQQTQISGDKNIVVNVGGNAHGNIVIGSNNTVSGK